MPSDFYDRAPMQSLLEGVEASDPIAIDRAIDRGADVNESGKDAMTPLMWAVLKNSEGGFRLLLERKADVTNKALPKAPNQGAFEQTPSIAEVVAGSAETTFLSIMLDYGIDPDLPCSAIDGNLIHRAIWSKNQNAVQLLLEAGADINRPNKHGTTPFALAVALDCGIASSLLRSGADPSIKDSLGMSALEVLADPRVLPETKDTDCINELKGLLKERGLL